MYQASGETITHICENEETSVAATCPQAERAVKLLNRAVQYDVKRRYTASARMYAQAESLPGFRWALPEKEITP